MAKIDLAQIRKDLHQIPELAFEEYKTKAYIKRAVEGWLAEADLPCELIEFQRSTGLLLVYRGAVAGGAFQLFRADMDALPLEEATGVDFSSRHPGIMHACGHDIHITVLLGLIHKVLQNRPMANLLFLFQPAEEGKGGAESILGEGLLQRYNISEVYALHIASGMPVGTISSRAGVFFGIPQEFDLCFYGKSAHVAFPEEGVNAIACAVDFLQEIQPAIRELAKEERIIVHVGKMQGGRIRNVIADECCLEGTHRTLKCGTKEAVNQLLEHTAARVAKRHKARHSLQLLGSYDPVVNDKKLYQELVKRSQALGYQFVESPVMMTGEDFGFFTTLYPGLLFWLGGGCKEALHSSRFLPEESAIQVGIDVFYEMIR
ncbi:MAG: amidohydrolase [Candidatus Cloacimonadaceae bacterium]